MKQCNNLPLRRKGFTLIEVLVTVSIIAILSSIGLATFTNSQKRARDARRQADLESVRSALELYRSDNPTLGYTTPAGADGTNAKYSNLGALLTTYLSALPQDPKNVSPYQYTYAGGGTTYTVCATQEVMLPASYCLTPP